MEKKTPPKPVADPRIKMKKLESGNQGTLLNVKVDKKCFGDREILSNFSLKIMNGEKILLRGVNGSVKALYLI